jgi:hypothetical protein
MRGRVHANVCSLLSSRLSTMPRDQDDDVQVGEVFKGARALSTLSLSFFFLYNQLIT